MPDGHFPAVSESPTTATFTSADLAEASALLSRFYAPLAVGAPAGPAGFELRAEVIRLGPLAVGRLGFGAPVTLVAAEWDAYRVALPTAGRVHSRYAGHEVVAGPRVGLLFGPGQPVYTRHDAHSVELDVKIERAALESELAALLGRPVEHPIDLPPVFDLGRGAAQSWGRLVRLLSAESQDPASLIQQRVIADQLCRSVLHGFLLSVPHRYRDELHAPAPAGPPRALQRVIDAIQAEPERSFAVADLARISGMSVRSLQESFRRHLGCAPMAYLQSVRLGLAHEALRREDPSLVTVATVAHRTGFAHLGRFAMAYRARFGVCPSETLRRVVA